MASQIIRRCFSTSGRIMAKDIRMSATSGHEGEMKLWRILTFVIAVSGVGLCMLNAYLKEMERIKHFHRPEFVPHEYLRIGNKRFPLGDGNHSLFHNPKVNAFPDGYED